ncbi:MAG: PepSY-associated TM helix domain-containing protein [Balneolales bacterium]
MTFFKRLVLFLHRWLGLVSGLVVVIVSITGCLFAFEYEISHWLRKDLIFVESQEEERLSVEDLQNRATEELDVETLVYGLTTYNNPEQAWTAMYYKGGADAWTYFGSIEDYRTLYINPYTGKTLGIIDEEKDFFQIVKGLHWSLLLATPIGQPVVVWSTVIFIILLVSGLILWWPEKWNKSKRKKSFKIKWKGRWRRLNYDLHSVLGFYFLVLTLIIAFTGLYWAFPTAKKTLYFLGTGEFSLPPAQTEQVQSKPPVEIESHSIMEVVYEEVWTEFPDAYSISLIPPASDTGPIHAVIRGDGSTYYERSDLSFDQYSGELLQQDRYEEKNAGEKIMAMNYDIHVGAIGGLPGKIIAFLASMISASLPITGFILWLDRSRRREKAENIANQKKGSLSLN